MVKKIIFLLFLVLPLLRPLKAAYSIYNPLEIPNNKFGIHITDENDLLNAASLVNSSAGDWGYTTIVIRKDERNVDKWRKILSVMKQLHLIPIVRIATQLQGSVWQIPTAEEVDSWAKFLDSLNWPVKNRYVIIFNEPNHAKEWGGIINPVEYAKILKLYSEKLKIKSKDFFILQAGFDASAPNSLTTLDEELFIRNMINFDRYIFNHIDGWTSHSYPNPDFIGKVSGVGRGSLRTYIWELQLLQLLAVNRNLPVFITETGWPHQEGSTLRNKYYASETIGDFLQIAAEQVWSDRRIIAVTPFILNYQSFPFLHFSWQKPNSGEFYPHYDSYRLISKIKGEPIIDEEDVLGFVIAENQANIPQERQSFWNIFISILRNFISSW